MSLLRPRVATRPFLDFPNERSGNPPRLSRPINREAFDPVDPSPVIVIRPRESTVMAHDEISPVVASPLRGRLYV